ncbi:hypothetical protein [Chryseobacterium sp.]|uniref:hypothetical protein n=1 Tax=Chryseobacterium sp. TaxID=1871047 RepID=UPI0025C66E80|nr:hypothetical protein [Chryseobacterium sp.]
MKTINHLFSTKYLKKYLYILSLVLSGYIEGQTITITGNNWTPSIPSIAEAGTNYAGTYESATNQLILSGTLPGSFLNLLANGSAKVSMHYNVMSWNNTLRLYSKRTGGTATISGVCVLCSATITGGTTYTEMPQTTDVTFFTINFTGTLGLGNSVAYSGINVQLQLSGVSVTLPATSYSAQIVYTIGAN